MKLTSKVLDRLILEVMNEMGLSEGKHIPFKSRYEAEQHKRKQQEEAEQRRTRKRELYPGLEQLTQLSNGIITEGDLIAEPDEDGFVKIKASALEKVLTEQNIDIQRTCNQNSYYKINQILDLLNRLNLSEKGDLYKKK